MGFAKNVEIELVAIPAWVHGLCIAMMNMLLERLEWTWSVHDCSERAVHRVRN